MSKIGVFPGSFDPFTKGHEAVVHKSLGLFDEIIIAVGKNSTKTSLFDLEKRMNHISTLFENEKKVSVKDFTGLTIDFCKENNAKHIIRGLRNSNDFEYETSIALMNFDMSGIDTVFFLTDPQFSAISSTIIREIFKNNGNIEKFVTMPELLV